MISKLCSGCLGHGGSSQRWDVGEKSLESLMSWLLPTLYLWAICSWSLSFLEGGSSRLLGFRCFMLLASFMLSPCRKPSEYIAAILELGVLVAKRHQQIFLHVDLLYYLTPDGRCFLRACRLVHDFTDAVIQERRRTLPSQGIDDFLKAKAKAKTLDFIDVLLLTKVGSSEI